MTSQQDTSPDDGSVERRVDEALLEVLGYAPAPGEDLTDALDSIQRLELLISLEERLSVPFGDDALAGAWLAGRDTIVEHVRTTIAERSSSAA